MLQFCTHLSFLSFHFLSLQEPLNPQYIYNTHIVLLNNGEKLKLPIFFRQKMTVFLLILCLKIYVLFTNDVVSFEQLAHRCGSLREMLLVSASNISAARQTVLT